MSKFSQCRLIEPGVYTDADYCWLLMPHATLANEEKTRAAVTLSPRWYEKEYQGRVLRDSLIGIISDECPPYMTVLWAGDGGMVVDLNEDEWDRAIASGELSLLGDDLLVNKGDSADAAQREARAKPGLQYVAVVNMVTGVMWLYRAEDLRRDNKAQYVWRKE